VEGRRREAISLKEDGKETDPERGGLQEACMKPGGEEDKEEGRKKGREGGREGGSEGEGGRRED